MKKIIAIVLAIVMMAAIAVPAFAADVVTGDAALATKHNVAGGTTITYGATQKYTVAIPENFNLSAATWTNATLTVSDYMLPTTVILSITVASTNEDATKNIWQLVEVGENKTGAANVPYIIEKGDATTTDPEEGEPVTTITHNGTKVTPTNDVILELDTASTGNGAAGAAVPSYLCFYTDGTAQVATFQDTLTFAVSIDAKG